MPLFKAWSEFFNTDFSNHLCDNVISNKAYWDGLVSAMEKDESPSTDEDVASKGGSAASAEEDNSDKEEKTIQEASASAAASAGEEMTQEVSAVPAEKDPFSITTSQVTKEDVPGEE